MPGWHKVVLLIVVGATHFLLLVNFGFGLEGGGLGRIVETSPSFMTSRLTFAPTAIRPPLTRNSGEPKQIIAALKKKQQSLGTTTSVDSIDVSASPPVPDNLTSNGRIEFFNADEVDITAYLTDGLDAALERSLPQDIESITLEFWIAENGSTLQVLCVDGACSDAVAVSLGKFSELIFSPAIKGNRAVASRKVIQIDVKPRFGL